MISWFLLSYQYQIHRLRHLFISLLDLNQKSSPGDASFCIKGPEDILLTSTYNNFLTDIRLETVQKQHFYYSTLVECVCDFKPNLIGYSFETVDHNNERFRSADLLISLNLLSVSFHVFLFLQNPVKHLFISFFWRQKSSLRCPLFPANIGIIT